MNSAAIYKFLETKTGQTVWQFLRFVCIGLMNTALNFLILNAVSKALGIDAGIKLGVVVYFSFTMAVIQSYLWNRTWSFGSETGVSLTTNFWRLVKIGALGAVTLVAAIVGSKFSAPWFYYAATLVVYLLVESWLWKMFGFHMSDWNHEGHSFVIFFIVTFIALNINSWLTAYFSVHVHLTDTVDLNKNIAAVLATAISFMWNFIGYKVVVFRK